MTQKQMTNRQLKDMFPDDDVCLEHIMRSRYGDKHICQKCGKEARYYRVKKRRAYECEHCGFQVYPTAGTPFENTRTPLTDWFTVMHMFCTTRNGVAAKEVQRQLGVTYKTAWRMCRVIREYMAYIDGDAPLGGPGNHPVEVDKAFIGGKDKKGKDDKAVVLGMVERRGEVITRVVASRKSKHILPHVAQNVRVNARIYADDAAAWNELRFTNDYNLETVNHAQGEYVRGSISVNTLEGFWSQVKRMVRGTHIWVSKKYLQTYLCEAEFRWNLRKHPYLMMRLLLSSFPPPERRET